MVGSKGKPAPRVKAPTRGRLVSTSAAIAAAPRKRGTRNPPAVKRRRIRLDIDERRAQLLALARRVFTARSYDGVSMDDLAAEAGISKGLLYHYFPTKRDLYIAGLRETANDLVASVTAAIKVEDPPVERVRAGLDAYLVHVLAVGGGFVALMRGGVGSDPEVTSIVEATRQAFLDQFVVQSPMSSLLASDPLVRLAVRGWIGMVEATSIEWVSIPTVPRATVRDMLVTNLLSALSNARV